LYLLFSRTAPHFGGGDIPLLTRRPDP